MAKKPHWTQLSENKEKVAAMNRKSVATRKNNYIEQEVNPFIETRATPTAIDVRMSNLKADIERRIAKLVHERVAIDAELDALYVYANQLGSVSQSQPLPFDPKSPHDAYTQAILNEGKS